MDNKSTSQSPFVYWFRVAILLVSVVLFIGLKFYLKSTLLFIPVIAPFAMALGFSYMDYFKQHSSKLMVFILPTLVLYSLGFYPWISNYEQVARSSSTASLDFVILPIWSTIYGFVLVGIYEFFRQIVLYARANLKDKP